MSLWELETVKIKQNFKFLKFPSIHLGAVFCSPFGISTKPKIFVIICTVTKFSFAESTRILDSAKGDRYHQGYAGKQCHADGDSCLRGNTCCNAKAACMPRTARCEGVKVLIY